MKNILITLICLLMVANVIAQDEPVIKKEPDAAFSLGILHGGGSLLGADFEVLAGSRMGLQVGAGFVGFGGAINYHLMPGIKSSMVSLQYWHQGVGDSFSQSLMGPCYVYRSKKIFTATIGLGYALEEGPGWPDDKKQPPVMLMYSLGIYLPVK